MTPSVRALLAVQLGLCPPNQPYFGDPHEEAWQIPSQKECGLQASGVAGQSKLNPFTSPKDWVDGAPLDNRQAAAREKEEVSDLLCATAADDGRQEAPPPSAFTGSKCIHRLVRLA
jgi:hypothetical protein